MLHEALTAAELLAERGARPRRRRTCPGSTASTRSGCETLADLRAASSSSRITRPWAASATRCAASSGRELTVFGVEGWPACGTPAEALRDARARRRLARRSASRVAARRRGVDGEAPSGSSSRTRSRRASSSTAGSSRARATRLRRGCRSCSRSAERRGAESGRRSLATVPWMLGADLFPAPSDIGRARRSDGSTSLSTGASATTRSRSGTAFATGSTASACGRDTRTSSSTRRAPGDCRSPSASTGSSGDGCSRDAAYASTTLVARMRDACSGLVRRERPEPPGGAVPERRAAARRSRSSATSRAGITRSARASSLRTSIATSSRTT